MTTPEDVAPSVPAQLPERRAVLDAADRDRRSRRFHGVLLACAVLGVTWLAHGLAGRHLGYIWDDDHYVTGNTTLRDLHGLWRIWFEPGAVPQYYPLVHTTFWLTWQAVGDTPWPYHLINTLCHGATAALLMLLVAQLMHPSWYDWRHRELLRPGTGTPQQPGQSLPAPRPYSTARWESANVAILVGLLFAVHPVHVESVAWVTERKNVLSGLFYVLAALAWLRAVNWWGMLGYSARDSARDDGFGRKIPHDLDVAAADAPAVLEDGEHVGRWSRRTLAWHALAFALFVAALLSKTVTCSLPAVLILVLWWRTEPGAWSRRQWRAVLTLVPWFAIGLLSAGFTAHLEREHVGAVGPEWAFSIADRCLIAGRALWFYLGKLAWPHPLAFFYTRWDIDDHAAWQYLYPLAFAALLVGLWLARRRIGRGPLVAMLCFAGTLVPALGFFNVYPHRYSFVADHFNYLGSVPIFVLAAAALVPILAKSNRSAFSLEMLSLEMIAAGKFVRPLWSDLVMLATVVYLCLLAGLTFGHTTHFRDEGTLWRDTIEKTPTSWIAYNNLGEYYRRQGRARVADAISCFESALALKPDHFGAQNNLALCYMETGDDERALKHFKAALAIDPAKPNVQIILNIGHLFARRKDFDKALVAYRQAESLAPHWPTPLYFIGQAEMDRGNPLAAVVAFEKAATMTPGDAQLQANLAAARLAAAHPPSQ